MDLNLDSGRRAEVNQTTQCCIHVIKKGFKQYLDKDLGTELMLLFAVVNRKVKNKKKEKFDAGKKEKD